jgi:hypothetical protein
VLITGGNALTNAERGGALAFFREARRRIDQAAPGGKGGPR